MPFEAIIAIISGIVGGGGTALFLRRPSTESALPVRVQGDYVTRKEHDDDMRELRQLMRDNGEATNKRLDAITIALGRIEGKLSGDK